MRTALLLSLCVVFGEKAVARLGDTRDHAEARYGLPNVEGTPKHGRPFMEGARELTFEYQGWKIRCALLPATDGEWYIVREEYRKIWNTEVYKRGGTPSIRDFERDAVLEAEGGLNAWSKYALSANPSNDRVAQAAEALVLAGKTWSRADGAIAREQLGGGEMTLELPQARKYEAELTAIKNGEQREQASKLYAPYSTAAPTPATPRRAAVPSPPLVPTTISAPRIVLTFDGTGSSGTTGSATPPPQYTGLPRSGSTPGRLGEVSASKSPNLWPFAIMVGLLAGLKLSVNTLTKRRTRGKGGRRSQAKQQTDRAVPPPLPRASATPIVINGQSARTCKDLTWDEFEILVGEIYRRKGYAVEISAGDGSDGGVDLVLRKDWERVLVQCKNWNSAKVGVSEIREFFGVVVSEQATQGIFVSAGEYTRDALEFAERKPIEIVDGQKLAKLIAEAQNDPGDDLMNVSFWAPLFARSVRVVKPVCPFCKSAMALRTSPRGEFWGCTKFPGCKGTREARKHLAAVARE